MQPSEAVERQALREDLRLYETARDADGAPVWAIQDPVTNRFYRIGWFEYECLLRWPASAEQIAESIERETPLSVDAEQVEDFARFLEHNQLLRPGQRSRARMQQQANDKSWRSWKWWLHNYLFVRVPLVRPQRFLQRLQPWVEPLFTRTALLLLIAASVLGLILVARQWDSFVNGVMQMLTPTGLLGFALALVVSKTLHEMGHAVVATRQGLRVGHMGVAFLVMWPMLYTDTGESWRLRSNRQRLAISVAGVSVEVALAGLATLAWALLDDGALRQAMLYLATTGWILSLALNVSPFMRFDGYFILSDLINFPNLHERAFAQARVWLRRTLLGLDEAYPEVFSLKARRALVVFAVLTWLYRLLMFLGIALAVYLFFFKALGIFLLCVELLWFIARPVWSEVSVWVQRWNEVKPTRRAKLIGVLLVLAGLLAVPWRFDVEGAAVARAERVQPVYAPFAARLLHLQGEGEVSSGTLLAQFDEPDLHLRAQRSQASAQALQQRLGGLLAEEQGLSQQSTLQGRLQEQLAEISSVGEETARLQVTAQFEGLWLDVDPYLGRGAWVNNREALGVLIDPSSWVVDAYVEQRQLQRIAVGNRARFIAEGQFASIEAEVLSIDSTRVRHLPYEQLADIHGGSIATLTTERGLQPSEALYRVRLRLAQPLAHLKERRGHVEIDAERRSLLWQGLRNAAAVLVRESGF